MHVKNHIIPVSVSPLFFGVLACGAGILAHFFNLSFLSLLKGHTLFYALLIACKLFFKKKDIIFIMVVSTILFWGARERYKRLINKHLALYQQLSKKPFDSCAEVVDLETKHSTRFTTTITLRISCFFQKEKKRSCSTLLCINLLRTPSLQVGDFVVIQGLSLPSTYKESIQQYLLKEGRVATIYLPSITYRLQKRPLYSFIRWRWQQRNRLTKRCSQILSPTSALLFCTLFLGMKCSHPHYKKIKRSFSYWGIMHYLSRSGLHVLIISSFLTSFLRLIPLHFFLKELLLSFFLFIYYSLSWPSIPFIRAVGGLFLYRLFTLGGVRSKALHTLSLVTLVVLFVNPLHLFALDFQLSFGLTWALAWFNEAKLIAQRKDSLVS